MRIAFITAGAAGMFCGSCMRDNALVSALIERGHDALLIPTYTPIRTDDADASQKRVFFGGINVFLQQKSRLFRHTPRLFDRLLDFPRLLKWVSRFASRTPYSVLGSLTISMLQGQDGNQRKELQKLIDWLKTEIQPEVILLTNVLLSGSAPRMCSSVLLPEPEGPVIATASPGFNSNDTPESTGRVPLRVMYSLCKFVAINGIITLSRRHRAGGGHRR